MNAKREATIKHIDSLNKSLAYRKSLANTITDKKLAKLNNATILWLEDGIKAYTEVLNNLPE